MNKGNSIFQVNLEGVLRILSESLHSTPHVFMREPLQNSVDATTARKQIEDFEPGISLSYYNSEEGYQGLIMTDTGIGLNAEEVLAPLF
jgi:molecular chaperone HtpG